MKILSLNINGTKAFYNRGDGDGLLLQELIDKYDPDIFLFQETKCSKEDFIWWFSEFENYQAVCFPNLNKKGYSGVAALIKDNFLSKTLRIDSQVLLLESDYDSGRIIRIELDDRYLLGVYVMNSGDKDDLRMRWDEYFLKYIKLLQETKPVVILGDFNVCKNEDDCWAFLEYFDSMPGVKSYEIDNFKYLIHSCRLKDTWRELHKDSEVKYSWFSYRGGSRWNNQGFRLDYALVDEKLIDKVKSCEILGNPCEYSDHSPILLEIEN